MMGTVLITGASRGIGAACAREFAREGYRVAIHYHNSEDKARLLCDELTAEGQEAMIVKADVCNSAEVRQMVAAVQERFGFIDVLVNNAGIALQKLFTETTDDEWEKLIATDLSSVFYCSKAVAPMMIREHRGCIVNIASMWGEVGASCEVAYSAAKAGVIGLTKALAKELGPSGIRVNAVSPGVTMTDMMAGFSDEDVAALREETPLCTLGKPEDIARAVVFLASQKANYITGQILGVNGGMVI